MAVDVGSMAPASANGRSIPSPGPQLSWRARLLHRLEVFFPPVCAPQQPGEHASYEYAKAAGSFQKLADQIGGLAAKRVLDFGCGWGGETLWLAERAAEAVGCDIDPQSIADAQRFKNKMGRSNVYFTLIENDRLAFEDNSFDAVFSTNVFEHVMQPQRMLGEIRRILKPGGSFLSTFGPLFYSPLGYHLPWVTQVPYAHLLFGLGPIVELRNTLRPPIAVTSWKQTGLNGITYRKFAAAVRSAGLTIVRLKRIPVRRMTVPANLPGIGNLFTFGIDSHLAKPANNRPLN